MPEAAAEHDAEAEQQLLRLARAGADPQAFSRLVGPYVTPIRRYLGRFTRDDADADDLTQDTLVTAWERLADFDGRGRFKAWLFSIAHRQFLQHARSRRRFWRALSRLRAEPAPDTVSGDAAAAASDLSRLLDGLDAETRAVLLLSRGVGLSHSEIATVTDTPIGTVKSLISRATRKLVDEHA